MSNREEVIDYFLGILNDLQKGNKNITMYREHLNGLSDTAFEELMTKLADGTVVLPYYCANLLDKDVDVKNALEVGDKLGLDFFQQLWLVDPVTKVEYLTPEKYFTLHLPVRRQSQHVTKGKSVAVDSSFIDSLTGQPAGTSKTSRLSLPEILNMDSLALRQGIIELIGVRGGYTKGFEYSRRQLMNTGRYSLKDIKELGGRATSTETLRSLLHGMHIVTNL